MTEEVPSEPIKRPDTAQRNVENTRDLAGRKFGRLTVVEQVGSDKNGSIWRCDCSCGNTKDIAAKNLRAKKPTQSCGCIQKEKAAKRMEKVGKLPNRLINLTEKEYNRWTVMHHVGFDDTGAVVRCQCSCGTIRDVSAKYLRNGHSTSCGCLKKELAAKLNKKVDDGSGQNQ